MNDRDLYPKPATAREAATYLIRSAIATGQTPQELIEGQYGIYRPDDNAVVGRLFGANPRRQIEPGQIGVIGFDVFHRGDVFDVAELWPDVAGVEAPRQATLFEL